MFNGFGQLRQLKASWSNKRPDAKQYNIISCRSKRKKEKKDQMLSNPKFLRFSHISLSLVSCPIRDN